MPVDLTAAASRYTADDNQCQMAFIQDAFALADAMAAELDDTPLSFDHLRAMGWEIHRVTADHPKLPIQAMTGFTKVDLLIGGVVVAKAATLGDLRTLTRILTR